MRKVCFWLGTWVACGLGWGGLTSFAADAAVPSATSLFDDPVVARGTGFEIHQSEVDDMVTGLNSTLNSTRSQTIPEGQRPQIAAQMLDRIVLTRIVQQRASDAEQAKARELAAKFVADTKAKARSEEAYRRQLIATGIKPEIFEKRAYEQALVETVIDREVKGNVTVSDDQVRDFYERGVDLQARDLVDLLAQVGKEQGTDSPVYTDGLKRLSELKKANLQRLERPETVRAQALLVYTLDRLTRDELPEEVKAARRERVARARERLQAGEEFAQVAREVSEDPDVEKNGGEYTTTRDGVAHPELRLALFTLPVGALSDIITTRVGFYLAKVLERTPAGKVPFEKVQPEIREALLGQEVQKRLPAFFEQLRKDFNVTYATNTTAAVR